ncbi:c-type cytochrome [Hymenobacter sp. IS2118]|uniref:c-type cytochrome n=1 Tax=Hymenobacter sp. IS2118 TaxID=1505605 RepID=UPI001F4726B8|nr:cytochrome c [Hymenobacter sp. IS2118]
MALIVVLFAFTLLSAAGLVGFSAQEFAAGNEAPTTMSDTLAVATTAIALPPVSAEEAAQLAAGDALFKNNCAQCHAVNEVVVGPALAGIAKRRSVSWLRLWIKNSGKVVASGDAYAVALYEKYNKQQMPSFDLSDKEVDSILAYAAREEMAAAR